MVFKNKVVIVTGAGQGLGAGFARDFAKAGAKVVLVARNKAKIEQVAKDIENEGGIALAIKTDIADYGQVKQMVEETVKKFGTVDVLINNAAVHKSISVVDTIPEDWDYQIKVNLNGTFYCTKEVLPYMIEKRSGKIINISSSAAKHFFPGFGAYAASKGGIVSFTHTLSEEVKNFNINVNAIYLGMTNTDYTRERLGSDPAVTINLDDMLQVDEVSKVVMYLASEAASSIMGAALDVFGKKS